MDDHFDIHNHHLTWPEIFMGHAEVVIPPQGMIDLAHAAGAPWNKTDPHAKLSELQCEIITAPERVKVVFGGSRGGKSIAGACIGLAQLMIPNSQIALIGANYEHCSKEFGYIWEGFFRLFPRSACTEAQFVTRSPHFSMRLATVWGARVQAYSVLQKEGTQILGNEYDLAILCEAAQFSHEVYSNKIERALLGRGKRRTQDGYLRRTGRSVLLTTPKGLGGASYDLYNRAIQRTKGDLKKLTLERGAEWFDSFYFKQCDVRELNPSYPVEAFEAARRNLPKKDFEEQFLGKAVVRSGLVYSAFREDTCVIPRSKWPSADELRRSTWGVGIDTGSNFAAVLACITPKGQVYILGEVFEVGLNTRGNADAILQMIHQVLGPIFTDPKNAVSMWCIDVNSQNILDLEEALDVSFYYQKYDVLDSIGHLDVKYGQGLIFMDEDLTWLLHEIRGYRYKARKELAPGQKDKPTGDDHVLDAKRYLLMQLFDVGPPVEMEAALTVDQLLDKQRNEMLTVQPVGTMLAMRKQNSLLEGRW